MSDKSSLKLIVIGSPGVGKSSLLNRFTNGQYKQAYTTTLGVQFCSKTITLDNNASIKLQIWDTAGQESFRSIINTFYRNVSMVFLMYSINNITSFKDLEFWYGQAVEHCQPDVVLVLIGSKSDKEEEREVTKEMAETFMNEKGIAFMFETSAKNNTNVDVAFKEAAKQVIYNRLAKSMKKTPKQQDSANRLSKSKQTLTLIEKKKCC